MSATAHQSRIYNFVKSIIEKHIKEKHPAIKEMQTYEKEGKITIASFSSEKETATFKKPVKDDKRQNGNNAIYCKLHLPPAVGKCPSQAPLKRAAHAYNTLIGSDDDRAHIDYNTREVLHGDKADIVSDVNDGCGPDPEHVSNENCELINEAMQNRNYYLRK